MTSLEEEKEEEETTTLINHFHNLELMN